MKNFQLRYRINKMSKMMQICLWLILKSLRSDTYSIILPAVENEELSKCIVEVSSTLSLTSNHLTIIFDENYLTGLPDFLHKLQNSNSVFIYNISRGKHIHRALGNANNYICFARTIKILKTMVEALNEAESWDRRGKIVIVLTVMKIEETEYMFYFIWQQQMLNVVFLLRNVEGEVQLVTFNPFPSMQVVNFGRCSAVVKSTEIFPNKLVDVHGRVLQFSTFHHPPAVLLQNASDGSMVYGGVDVELLFTVSWAMNFTPLISSPRDDSLWGGQLENGTWTGLIGDVIYRRSEMAFANTFLFTDRFEYVDISKPYTVDYCCWAVPRAGVVPAWRVFMLPFQTSLWISILAVIVVASFMYWTSAAVANTLERSPSKTFASVTLYLMSSSLGGSQVQCPRGTPLRIFFAAWLFYSLVLCYSYQGSLVSFFAVPKRYPDITTLEDLAESGLTVGGFFAFRDLFEDSSQPYASTIYKRFTPVLDILEHLDQVARKRDFALIESEKYLQYQQSFRYEHHHKSDTPMHIVEECPAQYQVIYMLPKGSPYLPRVDWIIERAVEAGLVNFWYTNIILTARLQKLYLQRSSNEDALILTITHLQGAFYILVFSLIFAFVCFLLELSFRRICGKTGW